VTSQGQRFRRRALRRGYKVDEVDSFLDRVEATLAGDPVGAPVTAQEVHDVVFRVRFGGYDEWQVDLHLDRVERQIAEMEERGGYGRGPERLGPSDRMGPPDRMGHMPMRDDRGMAPPPRPISPMPSPMGPPPRDAYGRYDEPPPSRYGYDAPDAPGGYDRPGGGYDAPPGRFDDAPPGRFDDAPPPGRFDDAPPPGRYDGPPSGGGYDGPPSGGGYDDPGYGGFEPGRHGKMDMTAEIRMPERDAMMGRGQGAGPGFGGPPPPPMSSGPGAVPMGDLQRIDMLRRTFQPRRFGSGYDPVQVDQLFEGIISAMSGRGPMPISEAEIEHARFGLVPGGYFEAEVDAALKEVSDILRRH
jgi:DivIVA domain-containing protein